RETRLALTYYFFPAASCTVATCQLQVGFLSSTDDGRTWSRPDVLAGPMQLSWLARTNQGVMVADYVSTSILSGSRSVLPAFVVAFAPPAPGSFRQATFSAREELRGGRV